MNAPRQSLCQSCVSTCATQSPSFLVAISRRLSLARRNPLKLLFEAWSTVTQLVTKSCVTRPVLSRQTTSRHWSQGHLECIQDPVNRGAPLILCAFACICNLRVKGRFTIDQHPHECLMWGRDKPWISWGACFFCCRPPCYLHHHPRRCYHLVQDLTPKLCWGWNMLKLNPDSELLSSWQSVISSE